MGIIIILILIFLVLFILTREIWIKIIKEEGTNVELHFPIFVYNFGAGNNLQKHKRKNGPNHRPSFLRFISFALKYIENTKIEISKFTFPTPKNEDTKYKYYAVIYTALAYLRNKARKLTIKDNSFILFSDNSSFQVEITLKLRLFTLINFLLGYIFVLKKKVKRGN